MTYQALVAAESLAGKGIMAEIIHVPTIKPLDKVTILVSAQKTKRVITIEEGQINGGLGGAICELLAEEHPVIVKRLGIRDHFGESGTTTELFEKFGLTASHIAVEAQKLTKD